MARPVPVLRYDEPWEGPSVDTWRQIVRQRIEDNTAAFSLFTFAAYGSMRRETPGAGADLGSGWQTVDFDTVGVAPRGLILDAAANTVEFINEGVYSMSITLGFDHNNLNSGRATNVRLFDTVDSAPIGDGARVPTGRNQEATTYSVTRIVEITQAAAGHAMRLEIGGGDDYASVQWTAADWSLWNVGEWRGALTGSVNR